MFRRLPSGLPRDPVFPTDLKGLGYFINDKDEIRSIENPKAYFKFFLSKNERWNVAQRESMNEAIRTIVSDRLTSLGLQKIYLPLASISSISLNTTLPAANNPYTSILVSPNLSTARRIVVLFYEGAQDLGVFAYRIAGGKRGINAGSAVDFVSHIQSLKFPIDNKNADGEVEESPAVVLANVGQMRYSYTLNRPLTQVSWYALPQKSAVDQPFVFNEQKNTVSGNRSVEQHIDYIFNTVIENLAYNAAKLDIIGVSDGAYKVTKFFHGKKQSAEGNWEKWSCRVEAFATLGTWFQTCDFEAEAGNDDFVEWYEKRARAYIISPYPAGTPVAPATGSKRTTALGCPAYSVGEPYYSENLPPLGFKTVIDWFREVARGGDEWKNEVFQDFSDGDEDVEELSGWQGGGVDLTEKEDEEEGDEVLGQAGELNMDEDMGGQCAVQPASGEIKTAGDDGKNQFTGDAASEKADQKLKPLIVVDKFDPKDIKS